LGSIGADISLSAGTIGGYFNGQWSFRGYWVASWVWLLMVMGPVVVLTKR